MSMDYTVICDEILGPIDNFDEKGPFLQPFLPSRKVDRTGRGDGKSCYKNHRIVGVTHARPVLNVWLQYARVELTPPSLKDIPVIRSGFSKLIQSAKTGRYREVTVREAVINTLVAAEIYCWFFVGECIGKRHFVGYEV